MTCCGKKGKRCHCEEPSDDEDGDDEEGAEFDTKEGRAAQYGAAWAWRPPERPPLMPTGPDVTPEHRRVTRSLFNPQARAAPYSKRLFLEDAGVSAIFSVAAVRACLDPALPVPVAIFARVLAIAILRRVTQGCALRRRARQSAAGCGTRAGAGARGRDRGRATGCHTGRSAHGFARAGDEAASVGRPRGRCRVTLKFWRYS